MQRLQETHGVTIDIRGDREEGDAAEGARRGPRTRRGGPTRILIQGETDKVRAAAAEIRSIAAQAAESNHSEEVRVDVGMVSRIIGSKGATVRELQETTGAKVDVNRSRDSATIVVKGSASSVSDCVARVRALLGEELVAWEERHSRAREQRDRSAKAEAPAPASTASAPVLPKSSLASEKYLFVPTVPIGANAQLVAQLTGTKSRRRRRAGQGRESHDDSGDDEPASAATAALAALALAPVPVPVPAPAPAAVPKPTPAPVTRPVAPVAAPEPAVDASKTYFKSKSGLSIRL